MLLVFSDICCDFQVSKYWNCLALDGSNWQAVDLFKYYTVVEVSVGKLI